MQPFAVPPPTRFDLKFKLFGFEIRVHPLFWVIALLFGSSLQSPLLMAIWVGVMFLSILVHELGHSLMMRRFQVDSFIVLYSFGGLAVPTSYRRTTLPWTQQILISFAGPLAGFLLAGVVIGIVSAMGGVIFFNNLFGVIPIPGAFLPGGGNVENSTISMLLWVNIYWGLINLLPVIPLDGGRISQQIFIRFDPWNGLANSLWLSFLVGAVMAVVGYVVWGSLYIALLFGMLAFQSLQMVRGM